MIYRDYKNGNVSIDDPDLLKAAAILRYDKTWARGVIQKCKGGLSTESPRAKLAARILGHSQALAEYLRQPSDEPPTSPEDAMWKRVAGCVRR